ncbi:hypothetical protein BDQ17DRAFT_1246090 [Cyathus striatus]|nr:hypothetical protein BDQ17DRAFT_1246090 [Cyathus striatus]
MLSFLLDHTPPEILQKIVLYAISDSTVGPPKELHAMLLTCRAASQLLSRNSGDFYMKIFSQKFDVLASIYRLGKSDLRDHAKLELCRRFKALKLFRSRENLNSPHLVGAFWIAYLMLEDSDTSQKNVKQLLYVRLPTFLDAFLRTRLYDGAAANNGWPVPNELNSLAISLAWLLSSQFSVNRELDEDRNQLLRLLKPFVLAAFRYPISTSHEAVFDLSGTLTANNTTSKTIHGPYPPQLPPVREVPYFGTVMHKARVPSAAVFASLLYFTRLEVAPISIPHHISESKWKTRREADLAGHRGPTLEDMVHFINHCRTRFSDFPAVDVGIQSQSLDMVLGQPTPYKLGSLSGAWQGSYIVPDQKAYMQWMTVLTAPTEFATFTARNPLYLTFQEHYTCDIRSMVPLDDGKNGNMNAWLPLGCQWHETSVCAEHVQNGVEFTDENGSFKVSYNTFRFGESSGLERKDIVDVIITGKTMIDMRCMGGRQILGRIRLADGLLVLLKESVSLRFLNGGDSYLMRGYVTSSQNLIGRFKGTLSAGNEPADSEAVFSLCKDNATMHSPMML